MGVSGEMNFTQLARKIADGTYEKVSFSMYPVFQSQAIPVIELQIHLKPRSIAGQRVTGRGFVDCHDLLTCSSFDLVGEGALPKLFNKLGEFLHGTKQVGDEADSEAGGEAASSLERLQGTMDDPA